VYETDGRGLVGTCFKDDRWPRRQADISGIFMMVGRPDSLGEYIVSVVIAV
jgi:hypothetical protein